MIPWRPQFELNIEDYPDDRLFRIVEAVRPEQCTLVPDAPTAFTPDEGWRFDGRDAPVIVRDVVTRFRQVAGRVIVFIDPDPSIVSRVIDSGADGVEIYTGGFAAEHRAGMPVQTLAATAETVLAVHAAGLKVNVGHDLNLVNLPALVQELPHLTEASIGHELLAYALMMGFGPSVRSYKNALVGPVLRPLASPA